MLEISRIGAFTTAALSRPQSQSSPSPAEGFGTVLKDAIARVNQLHWSSEVEIRRLLTGESEDLHTALLAVQKADMAFTLLMEVRNKVVQAYQEIMRIQV